MAQPLWFKQHQPDRPGWLIGLGQGNSYEQAFSNAQQDIANQLESRVQSRLQCETVISGYNGQETVTENCARSIESESDAELRGLVVLNRHEQRQGDGHIHFVKLAYDTRALMVRVVELIRNSLQQAAFNPLSLDCTNQKNEISNRFQQQLFDNPLVKRLVSQHSCYPQMQLLAKDAHWQLQIGKHSLKVARHEAQLFWLRLPKKLEPSGLSLSVPKEVRADQAYFVQMQVREKGLLSLFHVSDHGQAQQLLLNQRAKVGVNAFPNPQEYDGLYSSPKGNQASSQEYFIAALCQQPLSLTLPSMTVSYANEDDPSSYNQNQLFQQLIASQQNQDCLLASAILRSRR